MPRTKSVFRVTWLAAAAGLAAGMLAMPANAAPQPAADQVTADTVVSTLDQTIDTPGTAWGVDPKTDQVVVSYDTTVDRTELAELTSAVQPFGNTVRMEPLDGKITTLIHGGHAIIRTSDSARCSLGFNVTKVSNGRKFFLTAGHCAVNLPTWRTPGGQTLGPTTARTFGIAGDRALVRHDNNLPHPSVIQNCNNGSTKKVNGYTSPQINQWVLRAGSTTCGMIGQIKVLNVTVNYPQATVRGLFQANICAKPGDSGGSLLTGFKAVGLTSGGVVTSAPCTINSPGGTTFYEPVARAMNNYTAMRIP